MKYENPTSSGKEAMAKVKVWTSLYENHMIINWKCDLFSSKYTFLCA